MEVSASIEQQCWVVSSWCGDSSEVKYECVGTYFLIINLLIFLRIQFHRRHAKTIKHILYGMNWASHAIKMSCGFGYSLHPDDQYAKCSRDYKTLSTIDNPLTVAFHSNEPGAGHSKVQIEKKKMEYPKIVRFVLQTIKRLRQGTHNE